MKDVLLFRRCWQLLLSGPVEYGPSSRHRIVIGGRRISDVHLEVFTYAALVNSEGDGTRGGVKEAPP